MHWLDCPRCGRRPIEEFTFGGERRDRRLAALRLILSSGGNRRASDEQVVDFLGFAMHRGIDLSATWVATDAAGRVFVLQEHAGKARQRMVGIGRARLDEGDSHVLALRHPDAIWRKRLFEGGHDEWGCLGGGDPPAEDAA